MKKKFMFLCMTLMCISVMMCGCTSKDASSVNVESANSEEVSGTEEVAEEKDTAAYEKKDGTVYVGGEELTLERLLDMVAAASEQYRYSSMDGSCFDYKTKQIIAAMDRKLYINAFDTLSNSYYSIEVTGGYCDIGVNKKYSELYTSVLDYEVVSLRGWNTTKYTIDLDETAIPGTTCYKLTASYYRVDNDRTYVFDFFIDAATNLYMKKIYHNPSTGEDITYEVRYSNDPIINYKYEYTLPTSDNSGNTYQWYAGE